MECTISPRTTTYPRSVDGVADDRTTSALPTEAPFGSHLPTQAAFGADLTHIVPAVKDASEPEDKPTAPGWTLPQLATVLAGAGAAATSTLLGGQLGVAGTVIGAAVASIITTLAINLYDNTLRQTGHRLRIAIERVRHPERFAGTPRVAPSSGWSPARPARRLRLRRKVLRWTVLTALLSTLLGLGLMVGIERGTATQITPGTSQLAGTSSRSSTGSGTDKRTPTTGSSASPTSEASATGARADATPSAAPSGAPTRVPTSAPSAQVSADTTTGGGTTTGGTTSGGDTTKGSGTTTGSGTGTSGGTRGAGATTP